MVAVVVWGSLKPLVGGETRLQVEATNVRELLQKLESAHPGLKPQLERGVSISIDGTIFRDAWFEPIPADAEVHLLPRLAGG
ncbi:MAG: MoaD/ThiS family protein [Parvibaculaceae bacterium]